MLRFLVEYSVPNAGQLSASELQAVSQQWRRVLREMGPNIALLVSYVTDLRIYCIYAALDPALLREHARLAGLAATSITMVKAIIEPEADT